MKQGPLTPLARCVLSLCLAGVAPLFAPGALAADLPSCARSIDPATFVSQTMKAVMGASGQRLYLHPRYPKGCESDSDSACTSGAYLVSGDRVSAGETCGDWTYVRYQGKKSESFGWVESDRLADEAPTSEQATAETRYRFQLTRGKTLPVCRAYQERLNGTRFDKPPPCGIPEDEAVPGFSRLHRVYLSKDEIERLWPVMWSFARWGHERDAADSGWPASDARARVGDSLFAWRYDPAISIDNNGVPDNILVEQGVDLEYSNGTALRCGDVVMIGPQSRLMTLELEQTALVQTLDQ